MRAIVARPNRSLLDEAGLLLMTASFSDTQPLARAALDRLLAGQRDDGGWGWWPGGPPQPLVTAAAMEALAAAGTGLAVPDDALARGSGALQSIVADPKAPGDDQAHALYALALLNRQDETASQRLARAANSLGPQGMAYLLLAAQAAVTRRSHNPGPAGGAGAARRRPGPLGGARRQRGTRRGCGRDGARPAGAPPWPGRRRPSSPAYGAGSRRPGRPAAGRLTSPAPARSRRCAPPTRPTRAHRTRRYTIVLNGRELLSQSFGDVLTATRSLRVPLDQLQARNELLVTSDDGPAFLSYRIVAAAPPASPQGDGITLLREYLDPTTNQPLDLARLRAGQLVRARLTAIATAPRRFVTIDEPLPACAILIAAGQAGGFEFVGAAGDHLTLASDQLAPGIYQYEYLLQFVVGGRYAAPPPARARRTAMC